MTRSSSSRTRWRRNEGGHVILAIVGAFVVGVVFGAGVVAGAGPGSLLPPLPRDGYRPTHGHTDPDNPPRGGSGVSR